MKSVAARALAVGLAITVLTGVLHWWGVGLQLLLTVMIIVGLVAWAFPFYGVRLLDAVLLSLRRSLHPSRDNTCLKLAAARRACRGCRETPESRPPRTHQPIRTCHANNRPVCKIRNQVVLTGVYRTAGLH